MSNDAETAVLAGGCFWILQQLLRHPNGSKPPFPRHGVEAAHR